MAPVPGLSMQVIPLTSATFTAYPAAFAVLRSWKLAVAFLAPATSDWPSDLAATGMTNTVRARIARPTNSGQRRAGLRAMPSFMSHLHRQFVDLAGRVTGSLVDPQHGLARWAGREAEHLAGLGIEPCVREMDALLCLDREIAAVRLVELFGRDAEEPGVHVHVCRHGTLQLCRPVRTGPMATGSKPAAGTSSVE